MNSCEEQHSLMGKFGRYRKKYGVLHVVMSYLGRYCPFLWKMIGRCVTAGAIRKWLSANGPKILNLGGGSNCLNGCLTVDIDPRADAYTDIRARLPFPDASVESVFCEEVIEHLNKHDGFKLLQECFRILVPDGVIRIITPDMDYFALNILESKDGADIAVNDVFLGHGHKYLYTRKGLKDCCLKAGFVNPVQSSYQNVDSLLGHLDSHADRFSHQPEISQYLDFRKP
ncbi:MAG: methyltransferase domain-containing protein [Kiritimatiellae bacterium]|nr:methyltransferase domain-containing protein [Kiritimatiellia bacterium]